MSVQHANVWVIEDGKRTLRAGLSWDDMVARGAQAVCDAIFEGEQPDSFDFNVARVVLAAAFREDTQ